jgi:hypothetical protein
MGIQTHPQAKQVATRRVTEGQKERFLHGTEPRLDESFGIGLSYINPIPNDFGDSSNEHRQ